MVAMEQAPTANVVTMNWLQNFVLWRWAPLLVVVALAVVCVGEMQCGGASSARWAAGLVR